MFFVGFILVLNIWIFTSGGFQGLWFVFLDVYLFFLVVDITVSLFIISFSVFCFYVMIIQLLVFDFI